MAWIILVCAGLMEIVWAFFMKKSAGFTLLWPTAITVAAMLASVALLSVSMKTLPLGTAYTVWTGIGAVGAFSQPASRFWARRRRRRASLPPR